MKKILNARYYELLSLIEQFLKYVEKTDPARKDKPLRKNARVLDSFAKQVLLKLGGKLADEIRAALKQKPPVNTDAVIKAHAKGKATTAAGGKVSTAFEKFGAEINKRRLALYDAVLAISANYPGLAPELKKAFKALLVKLKKFEFNRHGGGTGGSTSTYASTVVSPSTSSGGNP